MTVMQQQNKHKKELTHLHETKYYMLDIREPARPVACTLLFLAVGIIIMIPFYCFLCFSADFIKKMKYCFCIPVIKFRGH